MGLALLFLAGRAAAEPTPLELRGSVDGYLVAQGTLPAATAVDPGERGLGVPELVTELDVRPSLRFELGRFSLLVRPRFRAGLSEERSLGAWPDPTWRFESEWLELYAQWAPSDALTLAFGRQNFQWGPAELLSPSNRLIHYAGFDATLLTVVHAPTLFRANLSAGKHWSAVLLLDVQPADQPVWNAGDPYERKGELKVEVSDGGTYLGVTAGRGETWRPWFGEYAAWEVTDGFSVYADAVHTLGSRAWYPAEANGTPTFARTDLQRDRIFTEVVAGARYTFAAGTDLRVEYFHDDAGWTGADLLGAVRTAASAPTPAHLGAYLAPGLDLPGTDYLYLSARVPDLGPKSRLALAARWLVSLLDESGALFGSAELAVTDGLLVYVAAAAVHGKKDAELDRLVRGSLLAAARYTW